VLRVATLTVGVVLAAAGCASANTIGSPRSSVSAASASSVVARSCVDADPSVPPPVMPAVSGVTPTGDLAAAWSLDGGRFTIAPAGNSRPAVDRAQALCTLLAALAATHFGVLQEESGLTLLLGKVTISDQLLRSSLDAGADQTGVQPPPPLTPFHSRLSWVAVIDPALMSSCPAFTDTSPPPPTTPEPVPAIVPYQALVLDATTGADGIVYQARTNQPCFPDTTFGPGVTALLLNMSVPWRLVSRDNSGRSGTIAVSVTACDSYPTGANTSRDTPGLVEFDVWRPVASCGPLTEKEQILRGPTVSDPLPLTLTHAPTGDLDVLPDT
jgi:hypothetical protein